MSFSRFMAQLLKTIHITCCEQFHVKTTFFLLNNAVSPHRRMSASPLGQEARVVSAQDVNINGILLSLAVMLARLVS